eukprot:607885_1
MPPKYSTRRHKYKNKNAKTNKKNKTKRPSVQRYKRINRPDEVTFNNKERVEFVTGFARRKQDRRIQAAKDLVSIQHQQHIELRKERREAETECLVKGGHMSDPITAFLEEDYAQSDYSSDSDETDDDPMDISEVINEKNETQSNEINYENDDMVTTVITSIPSKIDRNIEFMNETNEMFKSIDDEINTDEKPFDWILSDEKQKQNNGEDGDGGDSTLSVYQQRKEDKKRLEIRESKKKYQRKVKKMMHLSKSLIGIRNAKQMQNIERRNQRQRRENDRCVNLFMIAAILSPRG